MQLIALGVGMVMGCVIGWLVAVAKVRTKFESARRGAEALAAAASAESSALRGELEGRRAECGDLRNKLNQAAAAQAALEARGDEMQRRFVEQRGLLDAAQQKLSDAFRSLAADALKNSSESFLTLATERFASVQQQAAADLETRRVSIDNLVGPVKESLANLDRELRRIEVERRGSNDVLSEQLRSLGAQTNRLVDALKTPTVRGRWGEIQLRRVVEIAGMVEHCDFYEQTQLLTEVGRRRPDMTIRLPGTKSVVVDAKVPLQAYMEAIEAEGEGERTTKLRAHARQIRNHIDQLKAKSYWDALDSTPEFVVLFLPGEMFFSAALQQDAALIEDAAASKIILATPTTLIALLKAVAFGWSQAHLTENAERISELGRLLHDRLATLSDNLAGVGRGLRSAIESYNRTVGSLESRVMPAARRFRELGVAAKQEIGELEVVDAIPRDPVQPRALGAIEGARGK